jgi:hypothetical protein
MSENEITLEKLTRSLTRNSFTNIRSDEYLLRRNERTGKGFTLLTKYFDPLILRKELTNLSDRMKKEQMEAELNVVKFGILFSDHYVYFLFAKTEGIKQIKIQKLKKEFKKITPAFVNKFKKLLKDKNIADLNTWDSLFDRSDIIEEFYKLYLRTRENLLSTGTISGFTDDDLKSQFTDIFLMQLLIIWYLQEKGFFNGDQNFLVNRFHDYKTYGFHSFYEFLIDLFDKMMSEPNDSIYNRCPYGKIVVTGPAPFLQQIYRNIKIKDSVFYIEDTTEELKKSKPSNSISVPILNLFESRDWVEGDINEYVLGSLYEKLMTREQKKQTGSYYTPEEVTRYICKNTIKPYILEQVNKKFHLNYEEIEDLISKETKLNILDEVFQALKTIKILDPSVGSAHFLETAIDILIDLYELLWLRIKNLKYKNGFDILISNNQGKIGKLNFLDIDDKNQFYIYIKFFIILSRNIYGVDINPSAINIAKARLFLSIAKHFDSEKGYFNRFPNIHFNLRTGNSLIGFKQIEDKEKKVKSSLYFLVKQKKSKLLHDSIKIITQVQTYLNEMYSSLGFSNDFNKDLSSLNAILSKENIEWKEFREILNIKCRLIDVLIVSLNSTQANAINELINEINEVFNKELDQKFIESKQIDEKLLTIAKRFHWIFEFPEVLLDKLNFDIVIGNPPYNEVDKVDYSALISNFNDLYEIFIIDAIHFLKENGYFGYIHPNSAYCQPKFINLRTFLKENVNNLIIVNYAIRPQPVFKGVMQRVAITISKKLKNEDKIVKTSRYIRLTENNRTQCLENPEIIDSSNFAWNFDNFIPKLGNINDIGIFTKIQNLNTKVGGILDPNGTTLYFHDSGEAYWTKVLNFEPRGIRNGIEEFATQWKAFNIKSELSDFITLVLNSTLFYWFWLTTSDCRHLTKENVDSFPIPSEEKINKFCKTNRIQLDEYSNRLMDLFRANSKYVEKRKGYQSLEFKIAPCKPYINEIDDLIGKLYGFNDDEINYLKKYDLEMKLQEETESNPDDNFE